MMKIFVLAMCIACAFGGGSRLAAQDLGTLEGAWYRYLPSQKQQHVNGHYRLEVLSINPDSPRGGRMVRAEIYPDTPTRTRIRMGAFSSQPNPDGGLELRFRSTEMALANIRPKPEGFPVSTYLDVKGTSKDVRTEVFQASFVSDAGNSSDPSQDAPEEIRIGSAIYRNYAHDLLVHSRGGTAQDAEEFMRLLFIHIYTAESRVKEFGTMAMVGMDQRLPGLAGGDLHIQFQTRGFLGLGNSGVMFIIENALEFPDVLMTGEVFGGVYEMEGKMSLWLLGKTEKIYLGTMDCTYVKLKDGVCNGGNFLIELGGKPGTWYPVSFTIIAQ